MGIDKAVWYEQPKAALHLLELGKQTAILEAVVSGIRHAVFWAVRHDYLTLLHELIQSKADLAQTDELCGSALRFAVEQSRSNAAVALLEAGAWNWEKEKSRVLELIEQKA